MHRLAATPGGWTPDTEGVIFVEQTPAPLVFLTAADTEIQSLTRASFPTDFPALRVANLLQLQQQLAIDTYADDVLRHAQIIVVRLLGGRAYWPYGLEVVRDVAAETGAALIVLPGDDRPAPDLISHSTVPLMVANQLWRYLNEGGVENMANGLMWLCDRLLHSAYHPPEPQEIPKVGVYPTGQEMYPGPLSPSPSPMGRGEPERATANIGLIFYRAHYLAGNTAPIDALCAALVERHLRPVPVFVSSLQDPEVQEDLVALLKPKQGQGIDVLLNTTSFSVAKLDGATPNLDLWETLDVPVLQVILSGGTKAAWESQSLGLSPRDIAMNVALPEVDGRIITRAVSFKSINQRSEAMETDVVTYEPVSDRITFVADLAARWATLRRTPVGDRRIALILANYPNRDGRLANGVGLDTPQSAIEVLHALNAAGYTLDDIPTDGDDLIRQLTAGVTNDPEGRDFRQIHQSFPLADYCQHFETLPEAVRAGMTDRWGLPGGDGVGKEDGEAGEETQNLKFKISPPETLREQNSKFPIPGIQLGNVFIGVQPSRGYDLDPSLNYHSPDLEPTHDYLAFYLWLRHSFGAQAIVHLGKHGNLEWLPGKGVGLSQDCYPEAMFGPMPHFYPFIVNDPGEGSQAKRRAQAVILDHLTPPLTRAELYGPLEKLEGLVDEYYEAQSLDPSRLALIGDRILTLLTETSLLSEISPTPPPSPSPPSLHPPLPTLLPTLDTYLCDLKEAQIRDGLHIFGQCPDGRQLRDLVVAIARHPGPGRQGLTRAIAEAWGLDLDPLTAEPGDTFTGLEHCRIVGDAIEALEEEASRLVEGLLPQVAAPSRPLPSPLPGGEGTEIGSSLPLPQGEGLGVRATPLSAELHWIQHTLIPALTRTTDEIANLIKGLDGRYVPSGPAGAPTRNRPDVLPTGRNFFSVDIRAIPTESAWDVGRRAAEVLVEQYTQDHGDYPQTLGLSVWGTSTMRTGGDDIAEALALMGVRPVWDGPSRRVVDFEVLPLAAIGRPRVDVTLRISGFFRDAFPNLIDLVDQAVAAVAALEEPPEQNPLAARVRQESAEWQRQGLTAEQAELRSRYRIFGSKPGAYGAGLQGLIESQNWTTDEDLARAYLNWSGYAYGRDAQGHAMPEAFEQRLKHLQVVLHNQDNREHDLLDSDDYYQFQGGMTVAARTLQGQQPATYFGDNAVTAKPKVRSLDAEIAKVYRSRVVNPKWIEGVMRHGYKGAFEMAATVDYLFAYDATAHCVADHMYEGVAQAYLLDPAVQAFVQTSNPWALRDMAERLLEANQRGLWATARTEMLDSLRQIANQAEGVLETQQFNREQPEAE